MEGHEELQARLGHRFKVDDLLEQACRHASVRETRPNLTSNESLAFVGDAVVGLAAALQAWTPEARKGDLTEARRRLVANEVLAQAEGLDDLVGDLDLGAGVPDGRSRPSIRATFFEAIVGAVFLDVAEQEGAGRALEEALRVARRLHPPLAALRAHAETP